MSKRRDWIYTAFMVAVCVFMVFDTLHDRQMRRDIEAMQQRDAWRREDIDALRLRVDRIEAESAVAAPTGRVR